MEKVEQFYMFYDLSIVPNVQFDIKYTFLLNMSVGGHVEETEYYKLFIIAELYQRLIAYMVKNYYKCKSHFVENPITIIDGKINVVHNDRVFLDNKQFNLDKREEWDFNKFYNNFFSG